MRIPQSHYIDSLVYARHCDAQDTRSDIYNTMYIHIETDIESESENATGIVSECECERE